MALDAEMFAREERELIRLWTQAELRLSRIVRSIKGSDFQRARAKVLLDQVRSEMEGLRKRTESWLDRVTPRAYRKGFDWTGSGLRQGDWAASQASFGLIPRQAFEAVAAAVAADCQTALNSIVPNLGEVFIYSQQAIVREAALMEQVAAEIIAGQGPEKLARNLAATLKDGALKRLRGATNGTVTDELKTALKETAEGKHISILCRDGKTRRYQLRNYAETIARTAPRMAQTEGMLASCNQLGVDLVQVSVHSGACEEICAPIQGKVFSISGRSPDFPPLTPEVRCPLHPYCRHVELPAPEAFLRAKGVYDKLADFSQGTSQAANHNAYREMLAA